MPILYMDDEMKKLIDASLRNETAIVSLWKFLYRYYGICLWRTMPLEKESAEF